MPRTKQWNLDHVEEMRAYRKAWYHRNKDRISVELRRRQRERRAFVRSFKDGKKCLYCPENDSRALDWHHRDPKAKLFNISAGDSWSVEKLLAELQKCDLICANCHRKLTIKYAPVVQQ